MPKPNVLQGVMHCHCQRFWVDGDPENAEALLLRAAAKWLDEAEATVTTMLIERTYDNDKDANITSTELQVYYS